MTPSWKTDWLLAGGMFLIAIFAAGPADAHNTAHNYTFQDNGTIRIGREAETGGSIVWVSESGGANVVNNADTGRQIQMNVRDAVGDYNPTQAGDGPNASGSLIYFTHPDYTFSKCIPLLFYNLPPHSGPPRPASDQRFYMWSEFLPDSNDRGFQVRGYYENWDPRPGQSFSHAVAPADILNFSDFSKILVYDGNQPWSGGPLTEVAPTGTGIVTVRYRMTERWHGFFNNSNWGLAHLENFGWADHLYFYDSNQTGDHQWAVRSAAAWERFNMRIDPGEDMQRREGRGIYYLGDVSDARDFFAQYQPVKTNSFSDDFSDTRLLNWWRNSNPIEVIGGAVKMGPDTSWVNDMSLINKYWEDGTFSVDIRRESGTSWYGMAIRKTGQAHFWENQSGYYMVFLTPNGGLVLYRSDGTTLASANVPGYVSTDWNNLSVTVNGFNFTVRVNGVQYISASDPQQRFPGGYVSLVSDKNVTWFNNFTVTATGGDSTPPAPPAGFSVAPTADPAQLALSWTNPADADWRWTRITRRTDASPAHWRDGYPVYEGKLSAYVDPDGEPGETYYYAAYAVDHAGNWSDPVFATTALEADFSADPTTGEAPLTVSFTDESSGGPTSWAWDFTNDGSTDSVEQNPTFQYNDPGAYTVKLTVSDGSDSDEMVKTDYIQVLPPPTTRVQRFDGYQ